MEAALSVVPGVASATVSVAEPGRPSTLRIVLEGDADEADVAAAAHRMLRLQFGIGLDPAHIEVVEESSAEASPAHPVPRLQLVEAEVDDIVLLDDDIGDLLARLEPGPGPRFGLDVLESAARHPAGVRPAEAAPAAEPPIPGPRRHGRLAIARLTLSADGLAVTAAVTLVRAGVEHTGTAEGPSTGTAVHRTVAEATLRAIAEVLGRDHRLDVDAVSITALGPEQVAVVQVTWLTAEGSERLTGASEVRDDVRQAVIRATLDAVNRRLTSALAL
jgi:hypothetical protein